MVSFKKRTIVFGIIVDVVHITRNEGVDRSLGDLFHDGGDAGVGVGGEAIVVGDGTYIEMGDV